MTYTRQPKISAYFLEKLMIASAPWLNCNRKTVFAGKKCTGTEANMFEMQGIKREIEMLLYGAFNTADQKRQFIGRRDSGK